MSILYKFLNVYHEWPLIQKSHYGNIVLVTHYNLDLLVVYVAGLIVILVHMSKFP